VGFSISWVAVSGLERREVFERFGLVETGETEKYLESDVCGTPLPDGAYLLCLRDCFHRFVTPEFLSKASKGCSILGCQIEEHVMASAAFFYRDSKRLWNVVHESDHRVDHLEVEGHVPEPFNEIRREAVEAQRKEDSQPRAGGEAVGVDYIFDVPIRLAAALTGYSHDRTTFPWGKPVFARLAEAHLH
jgi:hypothetical protein